MSCVSWLVLLLSLGLPPTGKTADGRSDGCHLQEGRQTIGVLVATHQQDGRCVGCHTPARQQVCRLPHTSKTADVLVLSKAKASPRTYCCCPPSTTSTGTETLVPSIFSSGLGK